MKKLDYSCSHCLVVEKICRSKNGKGPRGCPTKAERKVLDAAMREYRRPDVSEFARLATIQEGACYVQRDAKPFVLIPTKTRVEELIEFSRRMKYKKLGMAFCAGLADEARLLSKILESHGFELVSVTCKVGGIPKEAIKVKDGEKVRIGEFESMCNPITQAKLLNEAKTDFNIMLGLCVGHDSLFLKYVKGLTTVFAMKDRVTGHNPMAALYTSGSYYRKLMKDGGKPRSTECRNSNDKRR
jgi:uncharacterized metal-binding protein